MNALIQNIAERIAPKARHTAHEVLTGITEAVIGDKDGIGHTVSDVRVTHRGEVYSALPGGYEGRVPGDLPGMVTEGQTERALIEDTDGSEYLVTVTRVTTGGR